MINRVSIASYVKTQSPICKRSFEAYLNKTPTNARKLITGLGRRSFTEFAKAKGIELSPDNWQSDLSENTTVEELFEAIERGCKKEPTGVWKIFDPVLTRFLDFVHDAIEWLFKLEMPKPLTEEERSDSDTGALLAILYISYPNTL
jgi:hypothetical protein